MKNKKYKITTLTLIIFSVLCANNLLLSIENNSLERDFEEANSLYSKNNFVEARSLYTNILEKILQDKKCSLEIFYNIGNCYFRENKLGYARYYYELAKLVNSQDKDVIYNLNYVKKLTNTDETETFLSQVQEYFSWQQLNILLFVFNLSFFVFLTISFFVKTNRIKIVRNILFVIFLLFSILFYEKYVSYTKVYGIIVEPAVLSSAPEENFSSNTVMINEAKKVLILSEKDDFYAVYLPQENVQGWIKKDKVKLVKL